MVIKRKSPASFEAGDISFPVRYCAIQNVSGW